MASQNFLHDKLISSFPNVQVQNYDSNSNDHQFYKECFNALLDNFSTVDFGRVVFVSLSGSRMYNTRVPQDPSILQDIDTVGIFCAPIKKYLGLYKSQIQQTVTNNKSAHKLLVEEAGQKGTVDYYFHEIEKFCQMLIDSNPTGVELLFACDEKLCLQDVNAWTIVHEMRKQFISKQLVKKYMGFAKQQLILAVSKYDSDEKKASRKALYTGFRVACEGVRLAKGKELKVVWKKFENEEEETVWQTMIKIRTGEVLHSAAVSKIKELIQFLEQEAKQLKSYQELPDDVSEETKRKLDEWVVSVRLSQLNK